MLNAGMQDTCVTVDRTRINMKSTVSDCITDPSIVWKLGFREGRIANICGERTKVLADKTSYRTKRPTGQNFLQDKESYRTRRPTG